MDLLFLMSRGKAFQSFGAATENALSYRSFDWTKESSEDPDYQPTLDYDYVDLEFFKRLSIYGKS